MHQLLGRQFHPQPTALNLEARLSDYHMLGGEQDPFGRQKGGLAGCNQQIAALHFHLPLQDQDPGLGVKQPSIRALTRMSFSGQKNSTRTPLMLMESCSG